MSGTKFLLDTNAVLYILKGDETLAQFVDGSQLFISVITQIELLSYHKFTPKEEKIVLDFIQSCKIIYVNDEIAKAAIRLRRKFRKKLPDTIIAATSILNSLPLISADRNFKEIKDLFLIFYEQ
jgi:predicted nucleic acid-binding protein